MVRDGLHCRLTSSVTSAPELWRGPEVPTRFCHDGHLRRKMARRHRVAEPRLRGVAEVFAWIQADSNCIAWQTSHECFAISAHALAVAACLQKRLFLSRCKRTASSATSSTTPHSQSSSRSGSGSGSGSSSDTSETPVCVFSPCLASGTMCCFLFLPMPFCRGMVWYTQCAGDDPGVGGLRRSARRRQRRVRCAKPLRRAPRAACGRSTAAPRLSREIEQNRHKRAYFCGMCRQVTAVLNVP